MSEREILGRLSTILADLLGDDDIALTMETTRADVPGWDSFAYVNFIVVTEMQLGVKFTVSEIESFENVGAIVRRIAGARRPA
jgi:acyl carrier protein